MAMSLSIGLFPVQTFYESAMRQSSNQSFSRDNVANSESVNFLADRGMIHCSKIPAGVGKTNPINLTYNDGRRLDFWRIRA